MLLHKAETELKMQGLFQREYWQNLLCSLRGMPAFHVDFSPAVAIRLDELLTALQQGLEEGLLLRPFDNLRHALLHELGAEPAEWDLLDFEINPFINAPDPDVRPDEEPEQHSIAGLPSRVIHTVTPGILNADQRQILPLEVYLESIRSPFNVGSIFRTAEAFGVRHIYLSADTPLPTHPRAARTARGCQATIPWSVAALTDMNDKPAVFALETGGTALMKFAFPRAGLVLIGSEELGLSPEALALAQGSKGRVTIPMSGAKRSLNVSVAFGIVMWSWYNSII